MVTATATGLTPLCGNFVRMLWRSRELQEHWGPWVALIAQKQPQAEIEMVRAGFRQAATCHISMANLDSLNWFYQQGLLFTPIRHVGDYVGFAHYHPPILPGQPSHWYGCLTHDVETGRLFREADLKPDHTTLGTLLGYPPCCTEFFLATFPQNYDPIWPALSGTQVGYPACNQMLRYFGIRLTTHFSCSPKCEKTRAVGEIWRQAWAAIAPEAIDWLDRLLGAETVWNSYHGIVEVHTPFFLGLTHTFPYMDRPRIIRFVGDHL